MVDGGVAPTTTSVNDLVATLSNFIPIDFGTFTISWDGYIDYSQMFGNVNGTNRAWFQDQLKIDGGRRPFSMPGDSGSLVMSLSDSRPAGLLFAGAGNFSYYNYISAVMRALRIPRI